MSFANPSFAWGFLALPLIVFFYLLRRRYQKTIIPSTYLWEKTQQDMDVTRPFQRLRRHLLLPIQLLLAAALALLLMQPYSFTERVHDYVFVLDASASMQAIDGDRTRFDVARDQMREILSESGAGDHFLVILASDVPQIVVSKTDNALDAMQALQQLSCGYGSCDMASALSLAHAVAGASSEIVVYTDTDISDQTVQLVASGSAENVWIRELSWEDGQLFVRLENDGEARSADVTIHADDVLVDAREVQLPGFSGNSVSIPLEKAACFRVAILDEDALQLDNVRYALTEENRTHRVAILEEADNRFLRAALRMRNDLEIVFVTDLSDVDADLYITGHPLRLSTTKEDGSIIPSESVSSTESIQVTTDDLPSGITMQDVQIREISPLRGGESLMRMGSYSILNATDREVMFGFDLLDSNLAVKVDFPLLMQALLDRLLPEASPENLTGICGQELILAIPATSQGSIIDPEGRVSTFEGNVLHLQYPGIYTVQMGTEGQAETFQIAMHLPESESQTFTTPVSRSVSTAQEDMSGRRDISRVFLCLCLALLILEWEVNRRVH